MQLIEGIRKISQQELGLLGMDDMAYIKPVMVDGRQAFAVHAADGTKIGVMAYLEVALAAVRQHDMEPVSVH